MSKTEGEIESLRLLRLAGCEAGNYENALYYLDAVIAIMQSDSGDLVLEAHAKERVPYYEYLEQMERAGDDDSKKDIEEEPDYLEKLVQNIAYMGEQYKLFCDPEFFEKAKTIANHFDMSEAAGYFEETINLMGEYDAKVKSMEKWGMKEYFEIQKKALEQCGDQDGFRITQFLFVDAMVNNLVITNWEKMSPYVLFSAFQTAVISDDNARLTEDLFHMLDWSTLSETELMYFGLLCSQYGLFDFEFEILSHTKLENASFQRFIDLALQLEIPREITNAAAIRKKRGNLEEIMQDLKSKKKLTSQQSTTLGMLYEYLGITEGISLQYALAAAEGDSVAKYKLFERKLYKEKDFEHARALAQKYGFENNFKTYACDFFFLELYSGNVENAREILHRMNREGIPIPHEISVQLAFFLDDEGAKVELFYQLSEYSKKSLKASIGHEAWEKMLKYLDKKAQDFIESSTLNVNELEDNVFLLRFRAMHFPQAKNALEYFNELWLGLSDENLRPMILGALAMLFGRIGYVAENDSAELLGTFDIANFLHEDAKRILEDYSGDEKLHDVLDLIGTLFRDTFSATEHADWWFNESRKYFADTNERARHFFEEQVVLPQEHVN